MELARSTGGWQRSIQTSSHGRPSSLARVSALPSWLGETLRQALRPAEDNGSDDEFVVVTPPKASRSAKRRAPKGVKHGQLQASFAGRRGWQASQTSVTHLEVDDDLHVLIDVKRQRLVYLVCAEEPGAVDKVTELLSLTDSKLVWIVTETPREHADMAQALMHAVPCSSWEINVSEDSFHPAQIAMLQARIAPGPSDGLTMPLVRLMRQMDRPDKTMGRMRRWDEEELTYCYMRELRSRGKRPSKQSPPQTVSNGPQKSSRLEEMMMMSPQVVKISDGLMFTRNRDLELVWNELTSSKLGPRLGRAGRVLGFLNPYSSSTGETLGDEDFQNVEVVPEGEKLPLDDDWSEGRGEDGDVEALSAAEQLDLNAERFLAMMDKQQGGRVSVTGSIQVDDDEEEEGGEGSRGRDAGEGEESQWSRQQFEALFAAYSEKGDLSSEDLASLMFRHKELVQRGVLPESMGSLSLTVTTNSEGEGIIIRHDGPEGSESGSGQFPADDLTTEDGFNCQMQINSDDPNGVAFIMRVDTEASDRGRKGVGPVNGWLTSSEGGAGSRAMLERCYRVDTDESGSNTSTNWTYSGWENKGPSGTSHPSSSSSSTSSRDDSPQITRSVDPHEEQHLVDKLRARSGSPSLPVDYFYASQSVPADMKWEEWKGKAGHSQAAPDASSSSSNGTDGVGSEAKGGSQAVVQDGLSKVSKGPDAKQLAEDLLGRDVSAQEAEELALALQQAASMFELPEVQAADAASSAAAAAALAGGENAALVVVDEDDEMDVVDEMSGMDEEIEGVQAVVVESEAGEKEGSGKQQEMPTGASSASSSSGSHMHVEAGTSGGSGRGGPGGGKDAGMEGSSSGGMASTSDKAAVEADAGAGQAGAPAAVGGARVTVEDLVAVLREKMNNAFGMPGSGGTSSSSGAGRTGGRKARKGLGTTSPSRPPRRPSSPERRLPPLPGQKARSFKVRTVSRLRRVVEGWPMWRKMQMVQMGQADAPRRWGDWGRRRAAEMSTPPRLSGPSGVTFLQAAKTVARLMELLHKPCDGVTSFAGQDLIVVLPGGKAVAKAAQGGPLTQEDVRPVKLLMTGEKLVEYESDMAGAVWWLAHGAEGAPPGMGEGEGGQEEGFVPLSDVVREVAATWNTWEQELMAPGVEATGMLASKYVQAQGPQEEGNKGRRRGWGRAG